MTPYIILATAAVDPVTSSNAHQSDLPAWVQAIGSIIAIFIAIYASHKQAAVAIECQNRIFREEKEQKYSALRGLVEAALDELDSVIVALKSDDPIEWFEENSGQELIVDFHRAFLQLSPLDMPSSESARLLVSLRDMIGTTGTVITLALKQHPVNISSYNSSVRAIESNVEEVRRIKLLLLADLHKNVISTHKKHG